MDLVTAFYWPTLVWRGIQAEQSQDVNIPHSIDTGEEGRGVFQIDIFVPFPFPFRNLQPINQSIIITLAAGQWWITQSIYYIYLAKNETNDSHSSAEESGQHEKFETVDDSFIKLAPVGSHGWQGLPFGTDVPENPIDDERKEKEIDSCRYSRQDNEAELQKKAKIMNEVESCNE